MEYTKEITLVKITYSKDSIGQVIKTETTRDVMAKEDYVGTKEFYSAMSVGLKPTAEFLIRKIDYENETELIYQNIRYKIIRTLTKGKFDLVLVVGIKDGTNG